VGFPGVKLGAASVAPLRAGAVHPHVTWAVTYTCLGSGLIASRQENGPFPCAASRFTWACPEDRYGSREPDMREVPGRLRAGVPWDWETERRETGGGNPVREPHADPTGIVDNDANLAGEVNLVGHHRLGREDT